MKSPISNLQSPISAQSPRVAIVHDWLTNLGGAERTVAALVEAFPEADLYTSVYNPEGIDLFKNVEVRTTWLQKIPGRLKFKHQLWAPLRPLAFRSLKLDDYDVIISSSSAEAKQASGKKAVHICYCHTPIRYFWVNPGKYKREPGLGPLNPLVRLVMPLFLGSLKKSDYRAAQKVDYFIANSKAVQQRIKEHYNQQSQVIYPPVQTKRFKPAKTRANYFVTAGRQVAYKRHDLAIEACTKLGLPLLVLGNGPEHQRLRSLAGPTITFNHNPSDKDIEDAFGEALGFIHPGEEDFGITPIEAMAGGCPVIAYKAGGALDYIVPHETGEFFEDQNTSSLVSVLRNWLDEYQSSDIAKEAEQFSLEKFTTLILRQTEHWTSNK